MRNHNCVYSKYCENYEADRCQGCRNVSNNDENYISNELSWFGIDENNERKNNMIFTDVEKKSHRDHIDGFGNRKKTDYDKYYANKDKIKDVIFNPPATIVFWNDGTKTIVKAGENDCFDPEKGLAMAIAKKFFGNKGNYYNNIRKHVESYEKKREERRTAVLAQIEVERPWRIWFKDNAGVCGRYYKSYKRKCNATQTANRLAKKNTDISYIVSQTDPWGEESDATCQA